MSTLTRQTCVYWREQTRIIDGLMCVNVFGFALLLYMMPEQSVETRKDECLIIMLSLLVSLLARLRRLAQRWAGPVRYRP